MGHYTYNLFERHKFPFKYDSAVEEGMLKVKEYEDLGLKVLKYSVKAFRKGEWTELLMNSRGTVLDSEDNIVLLPFTKAFNFGEKGLNGKKTLINRDIPVISIEKINGFMASVSKLEDGSFLYATTGTLDSDFVKMGKESIESQCQNLDDLPFGLTFVFEICHKNDPHIVEEKEGVYLIGIRSNHVGSPLFSETSLDEIAKDIGAFRPTWKEYKNFSTAKKKADDSTREGAMIRSLHGGEHLCKIKSKHYLTKKFLMRGKADKIFSADVDEDYKDVVESIKKEFTEEEWNEINEQDRRTVFELALEN
jgi:hypothetical protein